MSRIIKQYFYEIEKLQDERDYLLYCNIYTHLENKDRDFKFRTEKVKETLSKTSTEDLLEKRRKIKEKIKKGSFKRIKNGDSLKSL